MLDYIRLTKDEFDQLKTLDHGAFELYCFYKLVSDKSGKSWYSLRRIVGNTGLSKNTIVRRLADLEKVALVSTEKRHRKSTVVKITGSSVGTRWSRQGTHWVKPGTPKYKKEVLSKEVMEATLGFYSPDMVQ